MSRPLRVAIVSPVFPPYRGGMGTVAAHDADLLRARGVEVAVFSPKYSDRQVADVRVNLLKPAFAWGNAAILPGIVRALKECDVIHVHYPFFGTDILAAFASRLWRIPLVLTYHMAPKARGLLGLTFRVYRAVLQPIIFRSASVVLVSSDEYADIHGVSHCHREVFPFGVDTHRFVPGDQVRARAHFSLLQGERIAIFVGGLDAAHYFKGVDVLLRAWAKLSHHATLMIIGDGDRRTAFESLACELGIADRVRFLGSVSHEDLQLVYQAADVHVLPSIDQSEAFGIVTEEAMACGIPSIVSDLPGVRTLVVPGSTGLVIPPKNDEELAQALERLLADDAVRVRMGESARARCLALYSDDVLGDRLLRLYSDLAKPVKTM